MSAIWTPRFAQQAKARLPKADIQLPDGRVLIRANPYQHSESGEVYAEGASFGGRDGCRHESGLAVIAALEDTGRGWGPLLHVSMSYHDHAPTWEEIKMIRDAFFPSTVDVMMVLPRPEHYVNIHPHTFHLHQTPEAWGLM